MRALILGGVLLLSGCSLVLGPDRWMGNGDTQDAGADSGVSDSGVSDSGVSDSGMPDDGGAPECTSASECAGTQPVCTTAGRCVDCDADGDGFLAGAADCDELRADAPVDCDDTRADVHPGAEPVCGDGALNGCVSPPADVAAALGVEELGTTARVPLYVSTPDESIEFPTIVALQSSGGEINAAVATRAHDTSGSSVAWLFPFDHTAPAAVSPVLATPTSRAYYWVSDFDVWQTSPTEATMVVQGVVSEMLTGLGVPYFGRFGIGTTEASVDPVEPDREQCPFTDIVRRAWSARNDWYAFIGRNDDRTVYSLHAVSRSGSVKCIPDLAAVGVSVGEFPSMIAAGDVVIVADDAGGQFVWKPGSTVVHDPQPLTSNVFAEPPIVRVGDYEYLTASQGSSEGAVMSLLDCNRADGCAELRSGVAPTAPGWYRALTRWGSAVAMLTQYGNVPSGSALRHGVELRFVDATGEVLGGDFALQPFEVTYPEGGTAPEEVAWMGAATVPRIAGSVANDLLLALVTRGSDSTMTVGISRVRGCTER